MSPEEPPGLGIDVGDQSRAAFGAAFAIVVLVPGESRAAPCAPVQPASWNLQNLYSITAFAFAGAMMATLVILALARIKKMSAEPSSWPESLFLPYLPPERS